MMARKPRSLVFDSWALMAYLGDETAGREVADLLTHAHENRVPMQMSPTPGHVEEFTVAMRALGPARGALEMAWGASVASVLFGVSAAR